uniref:Uncharacterized protein n=1 Tax=Romanomermis culicivorax TaxID=13658 RepID=A0A915LBP6_ROMCU
MEKSKHISGTIVRNSSSENCVLPPNLPASFSRREIFETKFSLSRSIFSNFALLSYLKSVSLSKASCKFLNEHTLSCNFN